jgi:serine/threonine protein kinase
MTDPKIPDRYELLDRLGTGGMGTVYKVHDKILDKTFALKMLRFNVGASPADALRFQKEAKAAGSLHHKNIMSVIDFGVTSDSTPYMVLEFIDGQTLKDMIRTEGPLPVHYAVPLLVQIAQALECAHAQGIVHRDLKSHNVMISLDSDGQPLLKLYDFGIAQLLNKSGELALTAPQAVLGTPAYMSPEQASGKTVDHRTDIYSFGCVMFELLTGELPFESENAITLIDRHVNEPAPLLGDLIPELKNHKIESVVSRCLAKNPSERYQSAAELKEALPVEDQHQRQSELPTDNPPKTKTETRTLAVFLIAVCTILGLAGFLTISVLSPSLPDQVHKDTIASPLTEEPTAKSKEESAAELDPKNYISENGLLMNLDTSEHADEVLLNAKPEDMLFKRLKISDSSLSDVGLKKLAEFEHIKEIEADGLKFCTASGISALSRMPKLDRMTAKNTLFPAKEFVGFGAITQLKYFSGSDLKPEQVEVLSKLKNLEQLDARLIVLNKRSLTAISKLKKLKNLCVDAAEDLDGSALGLLASLPDFGALEIKRTPAITDDDAIGLKNIARFPHLYQLGVEDAQLNDKHLKIISGMKSLKTLNVSSNDKLTDAAVLEISKMPHLSRLVVLHCPLVSKLAIKRLEAIHPEWEVKFEPTEDPPSSSTLSGGAETITNPLGK